MGNTFSNKQQVQVDESTLPPIPIVEEGITQVRDAKFKLINQKCESSGIQDVLADSEKHHQIVDLPNGTAVLVIGSGYHIAAGFKPTPRGVTPAGGRPDPNITLDMTIEDIENAEEVKIRKNPLDVEKKELTTLLEEAEKELNGTSLETKCSELKDKLKKVEERRAEQLKEWKEKTINWLKTYAPNDPSKVNICFVREVLREGTEEKAKPSWVAGLIKSENETSQEVTKVIDCGTNKISVVDSDGCYTLNEKYDENDWTAEGYIERVKEAHPKENIIARLTGDWRKDLGKSQELIEKLEENGIPAAILAHEKEAEYAARHTLDICSPYYPHAKHIFCEELGGGSWQATLFERQ